MTTSKLKWPVLALMGALLFAGCKKDHGEDHEEEVITTVVLRLTPSTGGTALQFTYDDPDGPGGNQPNVQNIVLAPATTYNFTVEFLDKTKNPVANITSEIMEEAEEHRMYYLPGAGSNITVSGLNNDRNGIPLGTSGVMTTGASANGTLRVVLRHYGGNPPNKAAADAVDSPKSSTDADVTFTTRIQP